MTKCIMCDNAAVSQYCGRNLCKQHLDINIRSRVWKTLKVIDSQQKLIIFTYDLFILKHIEDIIIEQLQKFLIDYTKSVYYATSQKIINQLKLETNKYLILPDLIPDTKYYDNLQLIQDFCTKNEVQAIIDCSFGDVVAHRALEAVAYHGSLAQAHQLAQPQIILDICGDFKPNLNNLKYQNMKFVGHKHIYILRPYLSVSQCHIQALLEQNQAEKLKQQIKLFTDPINDMTQYYNNINAISRHKLIDGSKCNICGGIYRESCCCKEILQHH